MEILHYILNTLNSIRVSGKEDVQKLLGCILALEALLKENDNEEKEEEKENG